MRPEWARTKREPQKGETVGIMGLEELREQENGAAVAGALGTEELQSPGTKETEQRRRNRAGMGQGKQQGHGRDTKVFLGEREAQGEPEHNQGRGKVSQSVDPRGMGAAGENRGEATPEGWGTLREPWKLARGEG